MLAVITLPEAIAYYVLIMLAILALLLALDAWRTKVRHWKVSRVKLCECEECHLLFLVDRFDITHQYSCPRCAHINEKRRHSKSPWGDTEEKEK